MSTLTLPVNLLGFALAAAAVWHAGARLTRYVDAIAERQGLGRAFMGFLVLATATQLPEIVTNSTAALRGAADLVLNSMFGGISMQTAVLAVADVAAARYALTYLAESSFNLLQAALLVVVLALLLAVSLVGDVALLPGVGLAPAVLLVLYLGIVNLLWRQQHCASWQPSSVAGSVGRSGGNRLAESLPLAVLIRRSLLAALVILLAGVALVWTAEAIAGQSGLGRSFIGVTLLAAATSLPEVSTTLTAVRLGRHSMAVADILGSNLIMVALLLPADVLYRSGLLLDGLDASARFALALGVLVTAIYLAGLILRTPRRWLRLGWDSWAVLVCYGLGLLVLYQLR
ncbi:MAG: sodium:calcium antiporter [Gammaproteobacteria bacterium]|nr:sodium:calcium antiporter [Gammaproteobacteria bacterium]